MEEYLDDPSGILDIRLRLVIILSLLAWNVFESLALRTAYPSTLVAFWESPLWRVVLLFTVWLGAEWCPRIGLLTALAVVFYITNMIQVS